MPAASPLTGTLPVLPTPFRAGKIDAPSIERMLAFVLDDVDGITVVGSTGEAPSLSTAERQEATELFLDRTPRHKSVVVGIAHTDARTAGELAAHAEQHGARACLVPSPFYFANTVDGVVAYLRDVASHTDVDLVFYDNPYSTKTFFSGPELADIARQVEQVRAVKVTDHAIEKIAWLKENTDLTVFAGDDVVLFRSLLLGADGCMVIAPAVTPAAYRRTWEQLARGEVGAAYRIYTAGVLPFLHVFGMGREIAATKALYRHLGLFDSDEVRAPLEPCDERWRKQLIMAYDCCTEEVAR